MATRSTDARKTRGAKKGRRRSVLAVDTPQRSCIVCRASADGPSMLRFARATDGAVGFDVAARLPGRGAWVCATARCLDRACDPKHGGFARAFDAAVVFDPAGLARDVRAALLDDVLARLGLLRRQSAILLGREEVIRRRDELAWVGLAVDLSPGSRRDVLEALGDCPSADLPTMEEVGAAVGGRPVGVVGVLRSRAGASLAVALTRWRSVSAPQQRHSPAG